MKKYTTISFSVPIKLAEDLDNIANEMNINRSALITAIISVVLKCKKVKDLFTFL